MSIINLGFEQQNLITKLLQLLELYEYMNHVSRGKYIFRDHIAEHRGAALIGDHTRAERIERFQNDLRLLQEILLDFIDRGFFADQHIDSIEQIDDRIVFPREDYSIRGEFFIPVDDADCPCCCLFYQLNIENNFWLTHFSRGQARIAPVRY